MKTKIQSSRKIIKYILLSFFVLVLIPITINFILPLSISNIRVVGDEINWLSFWSGYLGAILSGLITLYVLNETLTQNQVNHNSSKEHAEELNRKQLNFQTKTLDYQHKHNWLLELRKELQGIIEILNIRNIESIILRLQISESNQHLLSEAILLEKKIRQTKTTIQVLYGKDISKEIVNEFYKHFSEYQHLLLNTLENVIMLLRLSQKLFNTHIHEIENNSSNSERVIAFQELRDKHFTIMTENKEKILQEIEGFKTKTIEFEDTFISLTIELVKHEEQKIKLNFLSGK